MKKYSVLTGSVLLITMIITLIFTKKPNKMYKKLKEWKKERVRNAYYDSMTQEDIAWG